MVDLASALEEEALAAGNGGDYQRMILLAEQLIAMGQEGDINGLHLRARAFEGWVEGPADRLDRAVADYQRLTEMGACPAAFQNLARARMKQGPEHYPDAFLALMAGERLGGSPEILLGFAWYYRTKPNPDFLLARRYYRQAAFRGRLAGIAGCIEVSMMLDQYGIAALAGLAGVVVKPLMILVHGPQARFQF
jgi:hypothetical protein